MYCAHTHTSLMALFPGLHGWAGTRKVKPVWIILKQETVSGSGISWAMCKSASRSRQITMPVPHPGFLQAGCPYFHPTNSIKALKVSLTYCATTWNLNHHTFNGPLSGITRVSRYQKGKTNLDFNGARDSEWQWHRLGHMQVCTSLQTDNHASTPPLSFFTGRMPFLPPNQQRQSTEGTVELWRSDM